MQRRYAGFRTFAPVLKTSHQRLRSEKNETTFSSDPRFLQCVVKSREEVSQRPTWSCLNVLVQENPPTCFWDGLEVRFEDGSISLSAEGEGDQHDVSRGRQLHDGR